MPMTYLTGKYHSAFINVWINLLIIKTLYWGGEWFKPRGPPSDATLQVDIIRISDRFQEYFHALLNRSV